MSNVFESIFLTLVLPAPRGCDLACPFCGIAQRGEGEESHLTTADYVHFVDEVSQAFPISAVSIQGYEALLPETWETTVAVLRTADQHNQDTRLVTNGTNLALRAEPLSKLLDVVTISLDSADPATHDKLRGKVGTFEKTVAGIKAACQFFRRTDEAVPHVVVGSVLFPGKSHYLKGMLPLLAELGVPNWEIGPYVNFLDSSLVAHEGAFRELRETILALHEEGKKWGVRVAFSDEFRRYKDLAHYQELMPQILGNQQYLIRLSPDGSCSRRLECFQPSEHAPRWNPNQEAPADFLARILDEVRVQVLRRSED